MKHLWKRWYAKIGIAVVAVAIIATTIIPLAGCGSKTNEITVGTALWNYDLMTNLIVVYALEDEGYEVTLKEINEMGIMFAGVDGGDIDLYAQAWLPAIHASYMENVEDVLTGGNLMGQGNPYRWAIPTWVSEKYNIKSIPDLKGKGDIFKGVITGLEEGTGGTIVSREAVTAYGLEDDLEYVASSISAMVAEVYAASKIDKPIIAMLWRPHPIFTHMDLTFLEDPLNIFGLDTVQWAMNRTFHDENPEVVTFMNNFVFPTSEVELLMARNEVDGEAEADLAREWYDAHKAEIDSWWD